VSFYHSLLGSRALPFELCCVVRSTSPNISAQTQLFESAIGGFEFENGTFSIFFSFFLYLPLHFRRLGEELLAAALIYRRWCNQVVLVLASICSAIFLATSRVVECLLSFRPQRSEIPDVCAAICHTDNRRQETQQSVPKISDTSRAISDIRRCRLCC
jgi:hypothetical protein